MESLKLVYDIINSEGPILQLYKGRSNALYLASRIEGSPGFVYYATTRDLLIAFANGNIKLNELYIQSPDLLVKHLSLGDKYTCMKEEFNGRLEMCAHYFQQVDKSLCHERFVQAFQV